MLCIYFPHHQQTRLGKMKMTSRCRIKVDFLCFVQGFQSEPVLCVPRCITHCHQLAPWTILEVTKVFTLPGGYHGVLFSFDEDHFLQLFKVCPVDCTLVPRPLDFIVNIWHETTGGFILFQVGCVAIIVGLCQSVLHEGRIYAKTNDGIHYSTQWRCYGAFWESIHSHEHPMYRQPFLHRRVVVFVDVATDDLKERGGFPLHQFVNLSSHLLNDKKPQNTRWTMMNTHVSALLHYTIDNKCQASSRRQASCMISSSLNLLNPTSIRTILTKPSPLTSLVFPTCVGKKRYCPENMPRHWSHDSTSDLLEQLEQTGPLASGMTLGPLSWTRSICCLLMFISCLGGSHHKKTTGMFLRMFQVLAKWPFQCHEETILLILPRAVWQLRRIRAKFHIVDIGAQRVGDKLLQIYHAARILPCGRNVSQH